MTSTDKADLKSLIQNGCSEYIIEILNSGLLGTTGIFNSLWVLTNLATSDEEDITRIASAGGIEVLIKYMYY